MLTLTMLRMGVHHYGRPKCPVRSSIRSAHDEATLRCSTAVEASRRDAERLNKRVLWMSTCPGCSASDCVGATLLRAGREAAESNAARHCNQQDPDQGASVARRAMTALHHRACVSPQGVAIRPHALPY